MGRWQCELSVQVVGLRTLHGPSRCFPLSPKFSLVRPHSKRLPHSRRTANNPWLGASAYQVTLLILQSFLVISTPESLTRLITLNQEQREARPSAGFFASVAEWQSTCI